MSARPWLGPWTLSADHLAATLGQLKANLPALNARAAVAFSHQPLVGRYLDLTERTAALIENIRAALATRTQWPGPGSWREPGTVAKGLDAVVSAIQVAWRRRAHVTIGVSGLTILRELLGDDGAPNILGILGREADENTHSDVLRWLLSPRTAPNLAPAILAALVTLLESPEEWQRRIAVALKLDALSVRREVRLGRETADVCADDRIDVLVCGPDFILAIENKIWSPEHETQTHTYAHWLKAFPTGTLTAGIFLTPRGHTARCSAFRPLSYLELVPILLDETAVRRATSLERNVLAGYLKTLANHVLEHELRALGERPEAL